MNIHHIALDLAIKAKRPGERDATTIKRAERFEKKLMGETIYACAVCRKEPREVGPLRDIGPYAKLCKSCAWEAAQ